MKQTKPKHHKSSANPFSHNHSSGTHTKPVKSTKDGNDKKPKTPFFGTHAVHAIFAHRPLDIKTLFVQLRDDNRQPHESLINQAHEYGISVQMIHKDKLSELCQSTQHQGIAAQVRPPALYDEAHLAQLLQKDDVLLLILDQITDAHNLGACMRTAAAMGADAIIVPKHQSASLTPTVAKVAVGASEMLPFISVTNLARTLELIKKSGVFVFGTALDDSAVPLHQCDFLGKVAIIMGSEDEGMRRLTLDACDTKVYIPMTTKERPQSLNVSVATGMVLYEVMRQRLLQ